MTKRSIPLGANATAWVNNIPCGPVEAVLQNQVHRIKSAFAMMGDPAWSAVDSKGHFHAFSDRQKLPTLGKAERVVGDGVIPKDMDPEDVDYEDYYVCLICGEEVEPRWIPDVEAREVGSTVEIGRSIVFDVVGNHQHAELPFNRPVSVRVRLNDTEYFGIGVVTNYVISSDGVHLSVELESPRPRMSPAGHTK